MKRCRNFDCNGACGNLHHGNRTWFFFSIAGGEKNQLVKMNLVNLNKQSKLFSQGMHPVMRNGSNGKWERTKEKPTFTLTDESFTLSFCHRTNENVEDNTVFYAFTFPFTYTEHIQALETYDRKHKKSLEELDFIVRELRQPCKEKIVIDIQQTTMTVKTIDSEKERSQFSLTSDECAHDGTLMQEKMDSVLDIGRSIYPALDENTSESMQHLSSLVHNVKIEKPVESSKTTKINVEDIKSDIYYYRELLVHSYEQRRVDLLTITSFDGIEDEREDRLRNLFPDYSMPRCHKFKNKKIIFISSRVHPGETPSSFVLNGFLNFLLDRKSQGAATLRKLYVFKIIPFLNPDGVFNGLYRSDTLGHNLNRVYLTPRLDRHPSIYAVRKLIRFFHFGCDKPEDDESENESFDMGNADDIDSVDFMSENINDNGQGAAVDDYDLMGADKEEIAAKKVVRMEEEEGDQEEMEANLENIVKIKVTPKVSLSTNERKHIIGTKPRYNLNKKLKETAMTVKNMMSSERRSYSKDDSSSSCSRTKHFISHHNCEKTAEKMYQLHMQNQQNINISMDYRIKTDENGDKTIGEENTNLFLYLDLHGHASKKGLLIRLIKFSVLIENFCFN